jgi:hypothetical protein
VVRARARGGRPAGPLLHIIAETAQHAGHADILRESIDGRAADPLICMASLKWRLSSGILWGCKIPSHPRDR